MHDEQTEIEEMHMVEVTLVMCTLIKGVPSGPALIECTRFGLSFKGVGIFNEGKLTNSPFTCIDGDGYGYKFS